MDAFTDSFPTAQPVDGAAMTTSVPGARIKGTPLTLTLSIICHMPGDVWFRHPVDQNASSNPPHSCLYLHKSHQARCYRFSVNTLTMSFPVA